MKAPYEFHGICHTRNIALADSPEPISVLLPADYVGDFVEPLRPQDCCAVTREKNGSRPRRCGCRRRLWNPKAPHKAMRCCQAHRGREGAARAWWASRESEAAE